MPDPPVGRGKMGPPALATTWYGCFLLADGEIQDLVRFPQEPEAIADRLTRIRDGELLEEEQGLAKGHDEVIVDTRRLLALEQATMGEVPHDLLGQPGTVPGRDLLKAALVHLSRETIREGLADRSSHMVQAVSYLDESHEVENLLGERLVAWMTRHAPELVDASKDHTDLARTLLAADDVQTAIAEAEVEDSLGAPLEATEAQAIEALCQAIVAQVEGRRPLESFIESITKEMAPNLTKLVGPTITARLIHHAGGLEALAKLPSSTVQTLGAEKALFRHFTEGAPPPKHGVIYQHPLIYQAHPNDQGKISRALAGKATIAARVDAFGDGKDIGEELKGQVQARAKEVSRIGRRKAMARKQGGRR